MMPTIEIDDIDPRIQYTAANGQDTFVYPFIVFSSDDMNVIIDGTVTTDFTVTDIGDDAGGTVVLDTPLSGGETVTFFRKSAISRNSQFQPDGRFDAPPLERDLDVITTVLQELRSETNRAATLDPESTLTEITIPVPQANRVIAWNATADELINGPDIADIAAATITAVNAAATASGAASTATGAASTATTQAAIAVAAAASVSLPTLGAADTVLQVNAGGTALEYGKVAFANVDSGAIALEAEAQSGTATDKLMTPQRTAQAIAALTPPGVGRLLAEVYLTSTGDFTKADYSGIAKVKVCLQAAGGGGGGASSGGNEVAGGGGSAGEYREIWIDAGDLGTTETVTLGAAGSGGSTSGTDGGTATDSTFGSHLTCKGGIGGTGTGSSAAEGVFKPGGALPSAGTGGRLFSGSAGRNGHGYSGGSTSANYGYGGEGGDSFLGRGGRGGWQAARDSLTQAATAGTLGAGGGAGGVVSSTMAGAAGGPAICRIEVYS